MSAVVWMRRDGAYHQRACAHAFVGGRGLCREARIPAGTPGYIHPFPPLPAFVPADVMPAGTPFGRMCAICEKRAKAAAPTDVSRDSFPVQRPAGSR